MGKEKSRHFTFLLYPDGEGFPSDWQDRLETIGVPIAISPLHDKDKAKDGGFKKRHYHGIYIAKNPVTSDSVRTKLKSVLSTEREECKAVAMVQVVHQSIDSMYLYLTHESKDAIKKGKHVYPKKDIIHLNGFDIDRYNTLDLEQKRDIFNILTLAIREKYICNLFDLYDFIDYEGERYGLRMNEVQEVVKGMSSTLRLLFDGAYSRASRANRKTYGDYIVEMELKKEQELQEKEEMELEFSELEKIEFGIKEK